MIPGTPNRIDSDYCRKLPTVFQSSRKDVINRAGQPTKERTMQHCKTLEVPARSLLAPARASVIVLNKTASAPGAG